MSVLNTCESTANSNNINSSSNIVNTNSSIKNSPIKNNNKGKKIIAISNFEEKNENDLSDVKETNNENVSSKPSEK